jgi:hypothetical protein
MPRPTARTVARRAAGATAPRRAAGATAPRRAAGAAGAAALAALAEPKPRRVVRPEAPPLEVVERAPRVHRRRRLRVLGGLALTFLFASLLGMAIFHSMLVQGQLGIDRADDQIEQEQMRQRELREQAAALASPDRIVAEAQRRGMVLPQDRVYLPAVVPGLVVPPPEVPG